MTQLYYTPPSDEQFNELKQKALEIWNEYDDPYRTEKVNQIKDIQNVGDNFMYMVAMFDINNQRKLADKLSLATSQAVRERMIDGGNPEDLIPF